MADFWQNDPVVQPGQNNAPAGHFWANDEVVGGQEPAQAPENQNAPPDQVANFSRALTGGPMQMRNLLVSGGGSERPELFPGANAVETAWFQGLTGEFGDEIVSALGTPIQMGVDAFQGKPFDPGRSFNTQLEQNRATMAADTEGHPVATAAGNVGGALQLGGTLMRGGVTLMNGARPTVASMAGRGALEGLAYGSVYGAGADEGDLTDKLEAGAWGALWGALTGGAAGAVGGSIAKRYAQQSIPTEQALKTQVDNLYEAARQNGVTATQQQTQQLRSQLRQIATDEGLIAPSGRVTGNTNVQHILNTLDDYANGTMSVRQMQSVRNLLTDAAGSAERSERRIGRMLLQEFDDWTAPLANELASARTLNQRLHNTREIGQLVELAELQAGGYSQSGFENALRAQFRTLSRRIIKGQERGFSQEEAAAIRRVAEGGTFENFFRMVGKLAPRGPVSTAISTGVPFAIGNAFGGPVAGAVASGGTLAAGEASRAVATALTRNAAQHAQNLTAAGGSANMPQIGQVPRNVIQALIAAGGSQAPQIPNGVQSVPQALSQLM